MQQETGCITVIPIIQMYNQITITGIITEEDNDKYRFSYSKRFF